MAFNEYSYYSAISTSETKNLSKLNEVLEKLETLKSSSSSKDVEDYIEANFEIKNSHCYLSDDCVLEITENNDIYVLDLAYRNKNYVYCYKK